MNNPSQTKDMNELNNKISGILAVFHDEIINRGPYDPMRVSKASQEARNQIQNLITEQVRLGRESAKQEFREKFGIDPSKKYHVVGSEKAIIITEWEHYKQLKDTTLLEGEK